VRRAIRFDAEDADAHLLSAELEIEDGRVKPALRAWEAALKIAPGRAAELLERAAHLLTARGQATVYETMLRERLARLPDDAPSILALAQLLVHEGHPDEARTLLQGLISREPENVAAHVRFGRILLAASGHDVDPQLAKPYGELLDALDHGVKPEERS
jgi:cytochrome c-type biogenesis protein CcmH/NrfG